MAQKIKNIKRYNRYFKTFNFSNTQEISEEEHLESNILLNEKGEVEKGFPLKGSIHPRMAELHRTVILCGNGHGILYCYKTE